MGYRAIRSKPDFEGVLHATGRQFIFDCKVVSNGRLEHIASRDTMVKQVEHMLSRAEFGVICFFLIHFNARRFKRKADQEHVTVAYPVNSDVEPWSHWDDDRPDSINRETALQRGIVVPWRAPGISRRIRPDIGMAIGELL
jgi:penicillin-binding protein-related factor A (putative recombinase)